MRPWTPPMLASIVSWSWAGNWAATPETPDVYWLVTKEPSTATPSAPPSSRVVSFIAEPMPARSRGTALISWVVMGVIVIAMPPPRRTIVMRRYQYGVWVVNVAVRARARATSPRPVDATRSAPKRPTSLGVWGATAISTTETGTRRTAAWSGL